MPTPDRASASRSRPWRITHGALVASLSGCAIAAYAGCSSSTPAATPGEDSGPPPMGVDAGQPDVTVSTGDATPPPDSTAADVAPPTDQTSPPQGDSSPGADAAEAGPAPLDCTKDDGGDGLPTNLICTGLYSDWASKTVATANLPYTPGYVLWSDNANKARYLYVPPGTKIDTTDMDNWVWPVGTKIWKEFSLGPQRIETRHFVKTSSGWVWTTYRWTADGESGATRLDSGQTNVNGTSYEIPAHGTCLQCHGGAKDQVMGLDVINLGASTAVGLTLSSFIAANQLTANPPASVEIPEDSSGHARASLGWLHSNCGVACHNSNPSALAAGTGLYMKTSGTQIIAGGGATTTSQLAPYVTAVNVVPKMQPFSSEGYFRIYPGHPELSLIPTLDGARNNPNIPQMPPVVSHLVDTKDVNALITWISTMPIPDGGIPDSGPADAGLADAKGD